MDKSNWKDFCKLMNLASELTNSSAKSNEFLSFLFKMLGNYDFSDVVKAVKSHIEVSRFYPTPADIIQNIKGTVEERGQRAFQNMAKAIRQYGKHRSITFGDPKIHYCIKRLGGWGRICNTTEEQLTWIQKEFCNLYKQAEKEAVDWSHSEVPAIIMGTFDLQNSKSGFRIEPPKYIDCGKANISRLEPELKAIMDKQRPENIDINKVAKGF